MKDELYDLTPHKEINELKKQLQELKLDKSSPKELLNSINALTKSMDAMLKLFTEAAEELRVEEREDSMNKKLDKIIDQNKTIANSIIALSEMVEDFTKKQEKPRPKPEPSFQPLPRPGPNFQPARFEPSFNGPTPQFNEPLTPQKFDQPPRPRQGRPVAMPSVPFSDIEKPKKKSLFGKFKK